MQFCDIMLTTCSRMKNVFSCDCDLQYVCLFGNKLFITCQFFICCVHNSVNGESSLGRLDIT